MAESNINQGPEIELTQVRLTPEQQVELDKVRLTDEEKWIVISAARADRLTEPEEQRSIGTVTINGVQQEIVPGKPLRRW